jgi:hypothetical protein
VHLPEPVPGRDLLQRLLPAVLQRVGLPGDHGRGELLQPERPLRGLRRILWRLPGLYLPERHLRARRHADDDRGSDDDRGLASVGARTGSGADNTAGVAADDHGSHFVQQ